MILASASPRRKELLSLITEDFRVVPPNVSEEIDEKYVTPEQAVDMLAKRKAHEVASRFENETVIAADTVVAVNDEILGKPADEEDAKRMLGMISGKNHRVLTGVCIIFPDRTISSFVSATLVDFYPMSDSETDSYVKSGEPMDKAGAYAVQGKAAIFVKGINGDFYNVVGLPVSGVYRALKMKGVI